MPANVAAWMHCSRKLTKNLVSRNHAIGNCITEGPPVFWNKNSVLIQPQAAACLQMLLLAGFECLVSTKVTKNCVKGNSISGNHVSGGAPVLRDKNSVLI